MIFETYPLFMQIIDFVQTRLTFIIHATSCQFANHMR